jgi:hypothetical protein
MFGWAGNLNPEQTARIAAAKRVFYDGFAAAVADGAARNGAPRDRAGILVDERFDADILRDAKRDGRITCATVEKSGQGQFDFESGEEFARVQRLGEYLRGSQSHYMFELLVPATPAQLQTVGADTKGYDRQLRPALMVGAIRELQDAGVEPDVWKVEGGRTTNALQRRRGATGGTMWAASFWAEERTRSMSEPGSRWPRRFRASPGSP